MRSKEVLVVGDAQLDDRFSKDKSIQKHNIKSMACIPILSLGELNAMMYLENRKMADVFSPERIEIIKNISSQFGISVENALLYDNLNLKMQELRESEERLSLIYDSTADILFYIEVEPDDCFRFVSINQSFLEVTGLTREQIIGKRIEEVIPEPSVWMVLDNYKKAIKENRIVRWEETSAYPSGKKTGEVSIAPMNEKGICTYLVGSVHDITERKKAEEEARIQRETIARVSRATRMELLAGSIAHELNQPLTGILSNAQAAELMLQSGQWEPDELAEIMAEVIADTKRSGEVIRNLRELYRKQKGEFAPIDLNTVIDETIQLLHSEVVLQDVVLKTECASSLPLVSGIRIQLQQVFVNLVMNGMQAMSGTEKGNRRILIATALDAMEVKAWVEDCGTGIDADKIDRIFEPLVTWKSGGMGLGLAINNTIIEAHGGRMWVENRREGGARVGFTLPVLKEGKQA
jgi:PAS domain S-box-containing protein